MVLIAGIPGAMGIAVAESCSPAACDWRHLRLQAPPARHSGHRRRRGRRRSAAAPAQRALARALQLERGAASRVLIAVDYSTRRL